MANTYRAVVRHSSLVAARRRQHHDRETDKRQTNTYYQSTICITPPALFLPSIAAASAWHCVSPVSGVFDLRVLRPPRVYRLLPFRRLRLPGPPLPQCARADTSLRRRRKLAMLSGSDWDRPSVGVSATCTIVLRLNRMLHVLHGPQAGTRGISPFARCS